MSADVKYDDTPSENGVSSGLWVTYGKDEESIPSVSRVVDLMIVDGKVKKGIYQRELSDLEKSNIEKLNSCHLKQYYMSSKFFVNS